MPKAKRTGLGVRDDVKTLTYHRPPTRSEIEFGYGTLHDREFTVEEACHKGTRIPKRWLKTDTGQRYYR